MGIRTGKQYLESLNDGRCVHIDGEPVRDVTKDPRLQGAANTIAEVYDLQHRAELQDTLTFKSAQTGERTPMSFLQPKTGDDLLRRQRAYKAVADHTYGMMGRTPDFLNTVIAAMGAAHSVLDSSATRKDLGNNIRAYYDYCCANDPALTHVLINPHVDRTKPEWAQEKDLAAKVVKETDAGYYVTGARMVGTLAQLSNEILNLPSATRIHDKGNEPYTIGFSIPVNTPGVKILSRPSLVPRHPASFLDAPMSLRLDEGDAVVIFDNVFVPWERTFLYRDVEMANSYIARAHVKGHSTQQSMTRALSLSEFMCGLAIRIAQSTKVDAFPNVQNTLAELLMHVDIADALLSTAVQRATDTGFGTIAPDTSLLVTLQSNFYKRLDDMIDAIRSVGAGGIVGIPSYAELSGDMAEYATRYLETAASGSDERIRLMRLAADLCMSGFSGRMQLYERFYQGDPFRVRSNVYNAHPRKEGLVAHVNDVLADLQIRSRQFDASAMQRGGGIES